MTPPIEFVFFDLGNVILHFDHEVSVMNTAQLTGQSLECVHAALHQSGLQREYELGQHSDASFVKQFGDATGTQTDASELLTAISDMFMINRSLVPVIAQMHAHGIPIGILSNTCAAHWNFISNRFRQIISWFPRDRQILSYEARSLKPDQSIFQTAASAAGLRPERIFFTDDLAANVRGAREAGFQAEVFESTPKLVSALLRGGIRINV